MEINRESFEAWLFAQSPAREFNYSSNTNCIVCMFLKETTNLKSITVTPTKFYHGPGEQQALPMPTWLDALDGDFSDKKLLATGHLNPVRKNANELLIVFGSVQKRYIKLFGNPFSASASTQQSINTTHQNEPRRIPEHQEAIS